MSGDRLTMSGDRSIAARIVFDGGAIGNPGPGYGSYQLLVGEGPARISRLEFGPRLTSNEAEYLALIRALEDLAAKLARERIDPKLVRLEVLGDSQLVLNQVRGDWKVRAPHLRGLRDQALQLVELFGSVALTWQPRAATVRVLGH